MAISLILKTSPFNLDEPASPLIYHAICFLASFIPRLSPFSSTSISICSNACASLCLRSRFKVHFAVFQIFVYLSEYKRISLTASAYHNRVTTRHINHSFSHPRHILYRRCRLPELKPILLLSLLYPNPPFRCKTLPAFCRVSQSPPLRLVL